MVPEDIRGAGGAARSPIVAPIQGRLSGRRRFGQRPPGGPTRGRITSFGFDVTELLYHGVPNLVAVKVDDVLDPFIAPAQETNVANYGGIYRTVSLQAVNALHVRQNGIWVTVEGEEEAPVVRVRTWLLNQSDSARSIRLEHRMLGTEGETRAQLEARASIGPGQERFFDQRTAVINAPYLWSRDSPYLYQMITTVWDQDRPVDRCATRFGIRFLRHEASRGFILNRRPVNLHGVNRRQDYGFLGDAVPEAIAIRDVHLMKKMGVNFFRTSHYPQDPAVAGRLR
jgi:beta-galactosidase